MRRMVDHLNAQTLMAAHGAEVKLRSETERFAVGQKVPQQPTAQEVENHGLTHEPHRDWCELCQSFRARQDPHPASAHDRAGHSVISYDYGFCSRMDDGSDKLPDARQRHTTAWCNSDSAERWKNIFSMSSPSLFGLSCTPSTGKLP